MDEQQKDGQEKMDAQEVEMSRELARELEQKLLPPNEWTVDDGDHAWQRMLDVATKQTQGAVFDLQTAERFLEQNSPEFREVMKKLYPRIYQDTGRYHSPKLCAAAMAMAVSEVQRVGLHRAPNAYQGGKSPVGSIDARQAKRALQRVYRDASGSLAGSRHGTVCRTKPRSGRMSPPAGGGKAGAGAGLKFDIISFICGRRIAANRLARAKITPPVEPQPVVVGPAVSGPSGFRVRDRLPPAAGDAASGSSAEPRRARNRGADAHRLGHDARDRPQPSSRCTEPEPSLRWAAAPENPEKWRPRHTRAGQRLLALHC
jgi:hypothetical protein